MSQSRPETSPRPEISLSPTEGWHCLHLFYRFDRAALRSLGPSEMRDGTRAFTNLLNPDQNSAFPARMQSLTVIGQKADFGLIMLDDDPLLLNSMHQRLMSSALGPALVPAWSYVSLTEVSEYLPSVERYGERLVREGNAAGSEEYVTKLRQYEKRLEIMRRQRLTPDLPNWPAVCVYPMNKKRGESENWFRLPFADRERMMAEHGESGMSFAGRVTQLVTVGIGLDDWEWGVTLWARNPEYLKDIVYRMRFDEASARFGEFGPFYVGYQTSPCEILRHCGLECRE
jgi:peroxiredoxin